jgi:hypothetical protein
VAYSFKARSVEPEKQPLLANGSQETFVVPDAVPLYDSRPFSKNGSKRYNVLIKALELSVKEP